MALPLNAQRKKTAWTPVVSGLCSPPAGSAPDGCRKPRRRLEDSWAPGRRRRRKPNHRLRSKQPQLIVGSAWLSLNRMFVCLYVCLFECLFYFLSYSTLASCYTSSTKHTGSLPYDTLLIWMEPTESFCLRNEETLKESFQAMLVSSHRLQAMKCHPGVT